jgi:sulfate transport system permease protein
LIVLLPLAALVVRGGTGRAKAGCACSADPRRARIAGVSFSASAIAAVIASLAGALVAWVIVRIDSRADG